MTTSNEVLNLEPQLNVSLDVFKLIQPDLLTDEELVSVLLERGVASSLLPQSKDNLVSLFKRVAYPLPQREFKQNHRGILLMKQRQKTNHITFNESCADKQSSFTIGVSGKPLSNTRDEVKSAAARLKPPPDLINFEKKTIKLNSSKSSTVSLTHTPSSDLEKIVIKKRKTSESCHDSATDKRANLEISKLSIGDTSVKNKQQKLDDGLENGSCLKQECNGLTSKPVPKKVSLKRNHLFSKAPSLSTEGDASDKPVSEPDKKRKPITWP